MDSNRVNFKLWCLQWKEKSQKESEWTEKVLLWAWDSHWVSQKARRCVLVLWRQSNLSAPFNVGGAVPSTSHPPG